MRQGKLNRRCPRSRSSGSNALVFTMAVDVSEGPDEVDSLSL